MPPDTVPRASVPQRVASLGPYVILVAAWLVFFPGLFSEDSLAAISMVREGTVAIDWTAIWVYLVWIISVGGVAPAAATLILGLALVASLDFWMRSIFPMPWRAYAFLAIGATPTVWALGVTLWHDISMTAGLLLLAGLATRVVLGRGLGPATSWLVLVAGAALSATRVNGPVTVACAGLILLAVSGERRRLVPGVLAAAAISAIVLVGGNATADIRESAKPGIETAGLLADIGCAVQLDGIALSAEQQSALSGYGLGDGWTASRVCQWSDALYGLDGFRADSVANDRAGVVRLWASVLRDHPMAVTSARLWRLHGQLPVPLTGVPRPIAFIQSVITPNDMGIAWANPSVSEAARFPVRGWNAVRVVVGSPGVWLTVMLVILAVFWRSDRVRLVPTVITAICLQGLIFVFSPFSETRYGLFTVLAGYAFLCFALASVISRYRARSH